MCSRRAPRVGSPRGWSQYAQAVDALLGFLVVAGGFGAILAALAWLGYRLRRRDAGGALMGPVDEIYHPAAHRFRYEIQAQAQRLTPKPSPDDR